MITAILTNYGIDYWTDTKRMYGQIQDKKKVINYGLNTSSHFLLLWSSNAKESKYVRYEVQNAISNGLDKGIEIFHLIPFLAEGEQIIWQNLKFEATNIKKKVIALDVVTNYRIFQYDYEKHRGEAIMFLALSNVSVTNQQVLVSSSPNGIYSYASEKIIGISNVKTNNVSIFKIKQLLHLLKSQIQIRCLLRQIF
jgi:TIR domain